MVQKTKVILQSGNIASEYSLGDTALYNERSCWKVEPITPGFPLQVSLIHVGIAATISPEQIKGRESYAFGKWKS